VAGFRPYAYDGPVIDPLVLVRGVHFAATALAGGTVFFAAFCAEPAFCNAQAEASRQSFRRAGRWLTWGALAITILTGLAWLVWLASDILGASLLEVCLQGGAWSVLTETRFGIVSLARLALALMLGVSILWPALRWIQLAAGAGLVALIALIGHAGAAPDGTGDFRLAADILHLISSAAWVGALPALALLLHQMRRVNDDWAGAVATEAVRRFSVTGVASVAALLATGIVNSWSQLSAVRDLVTTDYGRLLLLKIGLFVAMIGIASVNRFHLTPRLSFAGVLGKLEHNSIAETVIGICVFLFVGALGAMAPPVHGHNHAAAAAAIPADASFVHIHSSQAMADVTIEPNHAGPVRMTIRLSHEDFTPFAVKSVDVVLKAEAQPGVAPLSRKAEQSPDGLWRVDGLQLGQAGVWSVLLTIDAGDGPPITLDAPTVIER
jgi:putative copper resistance protein D